MATPGSTTGRFTYDVATSKWDWDDEVYLIHGFVPGGVTPTTELVHASKHPDDRDRVMELLERVSHTGEAFSISYRIVRADGVERRVALVGEGRSLAASETIDTVEGYYLDLTEDFEAEADEMAQAAVAASAESRAVIEQAKGVLMVGFGLEPDAAFAMLRWWSRNRNIKIRDLARAVVGWASTGLGTDARVRHALDAALHDLSVPADPEA